jgi:hypothetical protein
MLDRLMEGRGREMAEQTMCGKRARLMNRIIEHEGQCCQQKKQSLMPMAHRKIQCSAAALSLVNTTDSSSA